MGKKDNDPRKLKSKFVIYGTNGLFLPPRADLYFYRAHDGTEADLVITRHGIPDVLVKIKYSTIPKLSKGFFIAKEDLATNRNFIVCPVPKGYPLAEDVYVLSYGELEQIFL